MNSREIISGGYYEIPGLFQDSSGASIDMTVGGRVGRLRIRKTGSVSASFSLSTANAGDWTWTSQSIGSGYWLFTKARTAALASGRYSVDVSYEDGTTTKPHLVGETEFIVRDSSTGLV